MNQWHYSAFEKQHGPVSEFELRQFIAQGVVSSQSLVWREGMVEWRPLAEVPELCSLPIYGATGGAYPAMMPGYTPTCGLSIASLVCGICSVFSLLCFIGAFASIPAVICGHLALKKIRESEFPMAGRGMAIAGLIMGYLGILFLLGFAAFYTFVMVRVANAP